MKESDTSQQGPVQSHSLPSPLRLPQGGPILWEGGRGSPQASASAAGGGPGEGPLGLFQRLQWVLLACTADLPLPPASCRVPVSPSV